MRPYGPNPEHEMQIITATMHAQAVYPDTRSFGLRGSIQGEGLLSGFAAMSRIRSIALFSLSAWFLILICPAVLKCAEQSPWLEIHSTHYTVITDAGVNRGREV